MKDKHKEVPGMVKVTGKSSEPPKVGDKFAAPSTTEEDAQVSKGQRAVNMLWETTQQRIALSVTWAGLAVAAWLAVCSTFNGEDSERRSAVAMAACVFLYGVANLVIGFYFGRTNHQKTGGVGGSDIGR